MALLFHVKRMLMGGMTNFFYLVVMFFFLVMGTLKIYSLRNFQICNTVLLTIVTRLYIISPWLTYFITGSLFPLIPFAYTSTPTITSDNHQSVLCIYELVHFGFFFLFWISHISQIIRYFSSSDLFHLA